MHPQIGILDILQDNLTLTYVATGIVIIFSAILTVFNYKRCFKREITKIHSDIVSNSDGDDSETEIIQENLTNGLFGQLKSAKYKAIERTLTKDQIEEEKNVEREQLAAILKLLKEQETELNENEIDENLLRRQLKLYR